MNEKKNIVQEKTYRYALNIIRFARKLPKDTTGYLLGKQLVSSGTSVGANVEEALGAHSKKDFIYKMGIAKREARESKYWIRLILDSGLIKEDSNLLKDSDELISILTSIVKTSEGKKRAIHNL